MCDSDGDTIGKRIIHRSGFTGEGTEREWVSLIVINKMIRRASPKRIGSEERFEGLSGIRKIPGNILSDQEIAGTDL